MNVFTKYVLLTDDKHVKAIVDKNNFPEAIEVRIQPFDLQDFCENPYVYTVKDGVYRKDSQEDTYRQVLENKVQSLTESNNDLTRKNSDLNSTISGLMLQIAELTQNAGGTK